MCINLITNSFFTESRQLLSNGYRIRSSAENYPNYNSQRLTHSFMGHRPAVAGEDPRFMGWFKSEEEKDKEKDKKKKGEMEPNYIVIANHHSLLNHDHEDVKPVYHRPETKTSTIIQPIIVEHPKPHYNHPPQPHTVTVTKSHVNYQTITVTVPSQIRRTALFDQFGGEGEAGFVFLGSRGDSHKGGSNLQPSNGGSSPNNPTTHQTVYVNFPSGPSGGGGMGHGPGMSHGSHGSGMGSNGGYGKGSGMGNGGVDDENPMVYQHQAGWQKPSPAQQYGMTSTVYVTQQVPVMTQNIPLMNYGNGGMMGMGMGMGSGMGGSNDNDKKKNKDKNKNKDKDKGEDTYKVLKDTFHEVQKGLSIIGEDIKKKIMDGLGSESGSSGSDDEDHINISVYPEHVVTLPAQATSVQYNIVASKGGNKGYINKYKDKKNSLPPIHIKSGYGQGHAGHHGSYHGSHHNLGYGQGGNKGIYINAGRNVHQPQQQYQYNPYLYGG